VGYPPQGRVADEAVERVLDLRGRLQAPDLGGKAVPDGLLVLARLVEEEAQDEPEAAALAATFTPR
jgi:hypothetical protein